MAFRSLVRSFCVVLLLGMSLNMWSSFASRDHLPTIYTIQVVNEFSHDPKAFTQSSVSRVGLQTGKLEVLHKMDASYFGEGLTLLGERLFQVTWLTDIGFIYDRENLSKIGNFRHEMKDGWGLANDGKVLFGSDETSMLYHLDQQTLKA